MFYLLPLKVLNRVFKTSVLFLFTLSPLACQQVTVGLDNLETLEPLIKGKRLGVVVNHTSVNKNGVHLVNTLRENHRITAIFAPEHGFLGNYANGEKVADDLANHIFSLHGKNKKPQPDQLKNVDMLIFDIQDVGTRFFTYISTLGYVMQAASENNIPLLVLDRPIYMGSRVEGLMLDTVYSSFIGKFPIPVSYGLTTGEMAQMIQGEHWLANLGNLDLTIIPLKNWQRDAFSDFSAPFLPPSPNIPDLETVYAYSGLCFLEGTNVSEGRGTETPFKWFGAPWFNAEAFLTYFNTHFTFPVEFKTQEQTPITLKGKAYNPKFEKQTCLGLQLKITNINTFNGFEFGLAVLHSLAKTQDAFLVDRQQHTNWLFGRHISQAMLADLNTVQALILEAREDSEQFKAKSKKYRLY